MIAKKCRGGPADGVVLALGLAKLWKHLNAPDRRLGTHLSDLFSVQESHKYNSLPLQYRYMAPLILCLARRVVSSDLDVFASSEDDNHDRPAIEHWLHGHKHLGKSIQSPQTWFNAYMFFTNAPLSSNMRFQRSSTISLEGEVHDCRYDSSEVQLACAFSHSIVSYVVN